MKEVVLNEGMVYPISLEFDLLAVTWSVESTGHMFTRIVSVMKENNKQIVMELGLDEVSLVNACIYNNSYRFSHKVLPYLLVQIVSPELLLVATHQHYHLYEIPTLLALDAHNQPRINQAQLIWSSKRLGELNFGRHIVQCLPGSGTYPWVNVVDLCHTSVNVLALSKQPENCHILQQTTVSKFNNPPTVSVMASTHVFWVPLVTTPNMISLQAQPYPTPLDRRAPLRRLHNTTDLSARSLEITLKSSYEVRDLSWDESGRLCMLVTGLYPEAPLIVLLLEFA